MNILNEIAHLISDGEIEKAYELIDKNEEEYVNNSLYWTLRGLLCLTIKEHDAANDCFQTALKYDPYNGDTLYNLAYSLEQQGDLSDAALYYGLAYRNTTDSSVKEELSALYSESKDLQAVFNQAAYGTRRTFIILSSCHWDGVLQRMHHIARSLAKLGNDVCYITPAARAETKNKDINTEVLIQYSVDNVKLIDNVKIYTPIELTYNNRLLAKNYSSLVQKFIDSAVDEPVVITYLPYQSEVIKSLTGNFFHIYECVDDHSDIDYAFWGQKMDIVWEQELMDRADAITTTATSLFLQRVVVEGRENVFMSRNAVNQSDFLSDSFDEIPNDLAKIPEPRIVYTGVVYQRFDERLFYEIVESNPDKSFIIIGPVQEGMLTKQYPNVYFLGVKKHEELKNYLKHCHIGIVPYIDTADMDIACDSIKQYEYLASGLPVITTFMPESAMDKIYTFLANTKDDFDRCIQECLSMYIDPHVVSDFLVKNSWNSRAVLLCELAERKKIGLSDLTNIRESLKHAVEKYRHPTFMVMYGLCNAVDNFDELETVEQAIRTAYETGGNKFIEKHYIRILMQKNKYKDLFSLMQASQHITDEIKQELAYREKNGDCGFVKVIANIYIGNIKAAREFIKQLKPKPVQSLYNMYLDHFLGYNVDQTNQKLLNDIDKKSPLYVFLQNRNQNVKKVSNKVYVSNLTNTVSEEFLNALNETQIDYVGFCSLDGQTKYGLPSFPIEKLVNMQKNSSIKVIVPYDVHYITQVRTLAEAGIIECYVAVQADTQITMVHLDKDVMSLVKNKEYNRTVSFSKFNAADSNVHALLKGVPEKYREKYRINVLSGRDVWTVENIVKVPLISSVTVSGFATFLYGYPKFTYNLEVGHAGVSMKACGLMDKKHKDSGGTPELFKKADVVCVASHLNMMVYSSFYAIPENKYEITGMPRNDLLFAPDSRRKLEELLGVDLANKRIVFNMPTFRVFEQINRLEGSPELIDSIKIPAFNYEKFDRFLGDNNLICVSKVHHGEEITVSLLNKGRTFKNLFFINNNDLEDHEINLYEILGAGDLLITDYSTVYNDYLFMNKPTIFVNVDIEEYRRERGLALEPYEFWTAGPKVSSQEELEEEVIKCLSDPSYFAEERNRLFPLFFKYNDDKSVERTWDLIDKAFLTVQNKEHPSK